MRLSVLVLLLLACTSHANPVEKKYPRHELQKFTSYKIDGLTLWQVTGQSMADRNGDRFVVGLDAQGRLVEGFALYQRAMANQPPMELARRAFDILLAGHGRPLDPAQDQAMFDAEDWKLVRAPEVVDGVLTFWYFEGEMAPQVTRGQLKLATGELTRRSAADIRNPPEAAIPGIRAQLQSKDPAVVRAGLLAGSEWKELAPDVEALLAFPDSMVRTMAIGILSNLHQPRSVAALIQMLERGPEWGDKSLAGQALVMRFKTPEAIAAVRAHVAKGGPGQEIMVLRDLLKDWDAGKRY